MNADASPPSDAIAQMVAIDLLVGSAGRASAIIDTFASWLLLGYSAVMAAILANYATVSPHMTGTWFKGALGAWAVITLLSVLEKWLASIAASAVAGADLARQTLIPMLNQGVNVDFGVVALAMERSVLWPMRLIVQQVNRRSVEGDHLSSARGLMYLAQAQGLFAMVQAAMVIWQLFQLYRNAAF